MSRVSRSSGTSIARRRVRLSTAAACLIASPSKPSRRVFLETGGQLHSRPAQLGEDSRRFVELFGRDDVELGEAVTDRLRPGLGELGPLIGELHDLLVETHLQQCSEQGLTVPWLVGEKVGESTLGQNDCLMKCS